VAYEVELKYRNVDHDDLRDRLAAIGATLLSSEQQEDHYLAHPSRDFRQTGEALRLRRVGDDNLITYKGPKLDGPTKTREEIELSFDSGTQSQGALLRLFDHLGFRPVETVRKRRETHAIEFAGRRLEIGLDSVESLGNFAEVEAIAAGQDDLKPAREAVLALSRQLSLNPDQIEVRSYLRMLVEGDRD
jgi:adenylate cyclase, class 2